MLKEKLMQDLKEAMKEKNEIKKNTVQMVRASILQYEKDNGVELNDKEIINIIAKEVKKRKDAAADFEKSGRDDLIAQNNAELEVLGQYLPKQLNKDEIEVIIKQIIEDLGVTSIKEIGNVMKEAKNKIGVAADGKTINEVVRALLN
jgi:uncharacterized protein YqeY